MQVCHIYSARDAGLYELYVNKWYPLLKYDSIKCKPTAPVSQRPSVPWNLVSKIERKSKVYHKGKIDFGLMPFILYMSLENQPVPP